LVGFSVLCSLLYLGVHLDRPNLEAIRTAELAARNRGSASCACSPGLAGWCPKNRLFLKIRPPSW
jgi:hypothetical protein